ncbi:MAG TPA: hypothetical protein GXX39_09645 [Syntrophothermus lipocalidus]|uniref:Uncharacterized protein n=1 Tax=Syntrophothermus lipocalidus (strain DSM 12680 / TGB-C1) TaxID=643648 RepID=D7CJW6_SYNLT|nr:MULTISPECIES: hypothetical protein [Syntrophothermus]ADI01080.1 conserved hypothetical protein [Syntrophothermus lipocalidus DSM 12680]NSW81738.1 hypothetical protein [Syntrophothermus sp.]HHV77609.1 hypothetical protein [Syntrophothermus lipocalidus]HOV42845.1 hypothetical protein [Syntrophothermus lipocalidus]
MLALLILLFLVIILIDVPPLLRDKMYRELAVFSVLMAIAVLYSLGQFYNWPLPNPVRALETVFRFQP